MHRIYISEIKKLILAEMYKLNNDTTVYRLGKQLQRNHQNVWLAVQELVTEGLIEYTTKLISGKPHYIRLTKSGRIYAEICCDNLHIEQSTVLTKIQNEFVSKSFLDDTAKSRFFSKIAVLSLIQNTFTPEELDVLHILLNQYSLQV